MPAQHAVRVKNQVMGETYEEVYDKLIISTGTKAIVPAIEGLDEADNVSILRNIPDMDKMKAYVVGHDVKTETVIGGVFIGLEMMENLVELGIQVQLVEMA